MFFRPRNDKVSAIAKTLAAACAIAHVSFFTLFAWRVIGRAGMGSFAWAMIPMYKSMCSRIVWCSAARRAEPRWTSASA